MTGYTMAEVMADDPDEARGGYAAARAEESVAAMASLRRNWERHPELRAEHGGSFERYCRAETYKIS